MKTTKEDYAAYMRWQRHILSSHPALPKDCKRPTLIAYAFAMAVKGTNGLDCFASDDLIKKELGLTNRGTVAKYRHLALNLRWFVPNGKHHGRGEGLDICMPAGANAPAAAATVSPNGRQPSVSSVTDAKHIRGVSITACPACQPLVSTGDIREFAEAQAIHNEAVNKRYDAPPW